MSCTSSVCFWLNYMYYCKIKHISIFKTFKILGLVWVVNIFLFSLFLLVGYILDILLFLWFIFTIIYIGKKYVFKKEDNFQ